MLSNIHLFYLLKYLFWILYSCIDFESLLIQQRVPVQYFNNRTANEWFIAIFWHLLVTQPKPNFPNTFHCSTRLSQSIVFKWTLFSCCPRLNEKKNRTGTDQFRFIDLKSVLFHLQNKRKSKNIHYLQVFTIRTRNFLLRNNINPSNWETPPELVLRQLGNWKCIIYIIPYIYLAGKFILCWISSCLTECYVLNSVHVHRWWDWKMGYN